MGFVWHERKTDAGIDGEIELRNPVTGEVANRLILIQARPGTAGSPARTTVPSTSSASRPTSPTG